MSTELPEPDEGSSLVEPFIVCASNGGTFDDASFVAGCYYGRAESVLLVGGTYAAYVPNALVPQLDLLAMRHTWPIQAEPWGEHPDEWTRVVIGPLAAPSPEEPKP